MRRNWIVVCWGGNGSLCLLTCIPVSWHQWWRDATGPVHIHSSPRIVWLGNYLHRKLNEKVKLVAKQSESDTLLSHLFMLIIRVWWDWWVFKYSSNKKKKSCWTHCICCSFKILQKKRTSMRRWCCLYQNWNQAIHTEGIFCVFSKGTSISVVLRHGTITSFKVYCGLEKSWFQNH